MSIANDPTHRTGWLARASFIRRAIEDLRTEISVAMQSHPTVAIMRLLAEADIHCELAQRELDEASARIRRIP